MGDAMQACVLRQAFVGSGGTTGSIAYISSRGCSNSSSRDCEANNLDRGQVTRLLDRQQQRTARGLQQVAAASVSLASARATAATGPQGAATSATLQTPSCAAQKPYLRPPYSHLIRCDIQLRNFVAITSSLCTDIKELQSVGGSCPVQVAFVKHTADWDVRGYILQALVVQQQQQMTQQVIQQQQQAAQTPILAAASTGTFENLGPFDSALTHNGTGHLHLGGLPLADIKLLLGCAEAPRTLVLQERVGVQLSLGLRQQRYMLQVLLYEHAMPCHAIWCSISYPGSTTWKVVQQGVNLEPDLNSSCSNDTAAYQKADLATQFRVCHFVLSCCAGQQRPGGS